VGDGEGVVDAAEAERRDVDETERQKTPRALVAFQLPRGCPSPRAP